MKKPYRKPSQVSVHAWFQRSAMVAGRGNWEKGRLGGSPGNYHPPAFSPRCARRFGGDSCLNFGSPALHRCRVELAAWEPQQQGWVSGVSRVLCRCLRHWDLRKCSMSNASRSVGPDVWTGWKESSRKLSRLFRRTICRRKICRLSPSVCFHGRLSVVAPAHSSTPCCCDEIQNTSNTRWEGEHMTTS